MSAAKSKADLVSLLRGLGHSVNRCTHQGNGVWKAECLKCGEEWFMPIRRNRGKSEASIPALGERCGLERERGADEQLAG